MVCAAWVEDAAGPEEIAGSEDPAGPEEIGLDDVAEVVSGAAGLLTVAVVVGAGVAVSVDPASVAAELDSVLADSVLAAVWSVPADALAPGSGVEAAAPEPAAVDVGAVGAGADAVVEVGSGVGVEAGAGVEGGGEGVLADDEPLPDDEPLTSAGAAAGAVVAVVAAAAGAAAGDAAGSPPGGALPAEVWVLPADVRGACAPPGVPPCGPPGVPVFISRCLDFAAGVRAVCRLGAAALAGTAAVAGAAAGTGSGTGGMATTGDGAGIGGGGGSVFTTTGAAASAVASPRTTGELGRLIRALPDADPGTRE